MMAGEGRVKRSRGRSEKTDGGSDEVTLKG